MRSWTARSSPAVQGMVCLYLWLPVLLLLVPVEACTAVVCVRIVLVQQYSKEMPPTGVRILYGTGFIEPGRRVNAGTIEADPAPQEKKWRTSTVACLDRGMASTFWPTTAFLTYGASQMTKYPVSPIVSQLPIVSHCCVASMLFFVHLGHGIGHGGLSLQCFSVSAVVEIWSSLPEEAFEAKSGARNMTPALYRGTPPNLSLFWSLLRGPRGLESL